MHHAEPWSHGLSDWSPVMLRRPAPTPWSRWILEQALWMVLRSALAGRPALPPALKGAAWNAAVAFYRTVGADAAGAPLVPFP